MLDDFKFGLERAQQTLACQTSPTDCQISQIYCKRKIIMQPALGAGEGEWGEQLWGMPQNERMILQGFEKDVAEQRSAFRRAREPAKERGLKYLIKFPAQFHVRAREEVHQFQKPQGSEHFVTSLK